MSGSCDGGGLAGWPSGGAPQRDMAERGPATLTTRRQRGPWWARPPHSARPRCLPAVIHCMTLVGRPCWDSQGTAAWALGIWCRGAPPGPSGRSACPRSLRQLSYTTIHRAARALRRPDRAPRRQGPAKARQGPAGPAPPGRLSPTGARAAKAPAAVRSQTGPLVIHRIAVAASCGCLIS